MKTFTTFKELQLPAPLHAALEQMNFITPTPVQAASLPPALEGKDILGSAQTGTGKTGAFGIPLLAKLYPSPGSRALILAPTRELAAQIHKVLREMSAGMKLKGALVVGGESFYRQKQEIKAGADYYVCTPGRLIDHLEAGLKLVKVSVLVLDEVDRMLDMGFAPQLAQIVPHIPKERQTLFFSATLPKEILAVAEQYLQNPVRVSIGATSQPIDKVRQENHSVTDAKKNELLTQHLKEIKGRVLIFARTKRRTDKVFALLEKHGFSVVSLHGGRTQGQRKEALSGFRTGTQMIMVATDIAGRGIDVDDIECVINFDLPDSREDYIHRIGRTARNGKTGIAMNYITPHDNDGKNIITVTPPKKTKPLPPYVAARLGKPTGAKAESKKFSFQKKSAEGFRKFSDKAKPFENRPRPQGDRPFSKGPRTERPRFEGKTSFRRPEAEGRADFSDRKPRFRRPGGDRPLFDDLKPRFRRPEGDRPAFGDRKAPFRRPEAERANFGDRKPRFRRPEGDRPAFSDRKPAFRRPEGDRPSFGDRRPPFRRSEGDRPAFSDRKSGPAFRRPEGDRPRSRPSGDVVNYRRTDRPDGFTGFRSGPAREGFDSDRPRGDRPHGAFHDKPRVRPPFRKVRKGGGARPPQS